MNNKIDEYKNKLLSIGKDIESIDKDISSYEEKIKIQKDKKSILLDQKQMIEDFIQSINKSSQEKMPSTDDIVNIAINVISNDKQMQRTNKIVSKLRDEGYTVSNELANQIRGILLNSKQFRTNEVTKYWEIIE